MKNKELYDLLPILIHGYPNSYHFEIEIVNIIYLHLKNNLNILMYYYMETKKLHNLIAQSVVWIVVGIMIGKLLFKGVA